MDRADPGRPDATLAYNPADQVTSETRSNDAYAYTGATNRTQGYVANGLNQYASVDGAAFTYDANGNLTSDGTTTYGYDAENRLIQSSSGAYLYYDPAGRLWQTSVGQSGITQFLYDGDRLTAEYDGAGNMLRRYVHSTGEDTPEIWFEGAGLGSPNYLLADHQGSIIGTIRPGLGTLSVNAYDEYGTPAAGNVGRFGYTGQAWLPELGLWHYKARVYSPKLGRFLQTDPVGYDDQVNLYAYVANDPVNKTDPSGEESGSVTCMNGACGSGSLNITWGGVLEAASWILPLAIPVAGEEIDGVRLAAKGGEVVERAMSRAELKATQETGLIRGGRDGEHFVSNAVNRSAQRAQQRLALPVKPEVRVRMEVPKGRFSSPSRVRPDNRMPGGGMERRATGDIPVRIKKVDEMTK